jgi:RNA polymerase sigma factor (sigma-70 family)
MVYGAGWGLSDPEAVIQEVTLRVMHLGRAGRIREETDFKSFVLTIARHTCTDQYRRERLRGSIETYSNGIEHQAASRDNPESQLEENERRELLRFIFQELSEDCRRLWRWVYGEELPAAEVAGRLGISVGNARVRVHRCLGKAREIHRRYILGPDATVGVGDHGG